MSETPELYNLEDKRLPQKNGCPFRHFVMPGPLDGSLTWRDIPCLAAKCAMYHQTRSACSITLIPGALLLIADRLQEILDAMPES